MAQNQSSTTPIVPTFRRVILPSEYGARLGPSWEGMPAVIHRGHAVHICKAHSLTATDLTEALGDNHGYRTVQLAQWLGY